MNSRRWFHRNLSGHEAEDLLKTRAVDGLYLVRPSQNQPGDFAVSVYRAVTRETIHIRVQNQGDFYDLYGGEKFATLSELILYYTDNPGTLKEKNGDVIDLKIPLNCEEVTTERWFHGTIHGKEAESLLQAKGVEGSYLVRGSTHSPGDYVISARVNGEIAHVKINHKNGKFDIPGASDGFKTLSELVEYYRFNPLVEVSGRVISLVQPFNATCFQPENISERVAQLEKQSQSQENFGKAGFWEEFEQLQQLECRHLFSRKEGARPENKTRNRYKNILPFDHTRVVLQGGDPSVIGSDYINANYISGEVPGSERCYIATQGCLPGTVNDFWRMVWQENSRVIVMTTNEVERGRNKCTRYWPEVEKTGEYGGVNVTTVSEVVNPHYILREFFVTHDAEPEVGRMLYHFHFKAWPDHGVPQDPGAVLGFLLDVTSRQHDLEPESPGPIVVHCSAGIGRTGTFIVIDIILNIMSYQGWRCEIDIQRTIQLVRSQRSGMVQTEQQYKFIYRAVLHHIDTQRRIQEAGAKTENSDLLYGNLQSMNTNS